MGTDKALLKWGEISLLDHMVQLLSTVTEQVWVVGRGDFPDGNRGKGPLGGILTALQASHRDLNMFLAVDLPLLTPGFLRMFHSRLVESCPPVLACRIDGQFPLCLGVHRSLTDSISHRISNGELAIKSFIEESSSEVIGAAELKELGFEASIFANANTMEDWKRLARRS
jgi:molybdopterin-guanine dinucleotide biosynthesis protein A